MNTKLLGTIAVGQALAYYTSLGLIVSIPLNDSQSYDLVVEKDSKLLKIEIKYTSSLSEYQTYVVDLRTTGGNKSRSAATKFDNTQCDILFVYCSDGTKYEIPSNEITNTSSINLGEKVVKYKV
jgi:hypothetical protein